MVQQHSIQAYGDCHKWGRATPASTCQGVNLLVNSLSSKQSANNGSEGRGGGGGDHCGESYLQ